MIGYLSGEVAARDADGCIIDVNGVGYRLACSGTTLAGLPSVGQTARLFTHLHVREDILALYGFATEAERAMFEALIGVSGIGPKVALQICSAFAPDAFKRALVTDDVDAICSVPGIGKKTAGRVVLELKEKLDLPDLALVGTRKDTLSQARSALENLGYSPGEVRAALGELQPSEEESVEAVVRSALKVLAS
ncbi:MAG: Holliday junction branch migration protein RuvA [Actinobacteria bacterium]|nr:Holliday junction branch migration protein RuvA [Actinomycetota bacterium]